ncbi:UPF0146 family protein [Thermococcus sp.]|uniref:UPF0146 family protein n=1 Tax=Thermococcus sp. TaxID=35749 RepID=UPI002630417F|nr:UPF0146 family protein [Thermococcus sp.]
MPIEDFADFLLKNTNGQLMELGIGFQFKVALRLIELGREVTAVDWNPESIEKARELGIKAVRDDLFSPNFELYRGVKALYSVRPTPEIVKPILELSKKLGVSLYVLPLAGDSMPKSMRLVNFRGLAIYVYNPRRK